MTGTTSANTSTCTGAGGRRSVHCQLVTCRSPKVNPAAGPFLIANRSFAPSWQPEMLNRVLMCGQPPSKRVAKLRPFPRWS